MLGWRWPGDLKTVGRRFDVGHFDFRVDGKCIELALVGAGMLAFGAGAVVTQPEGWIAHGGPVEVDQDFLVGHVVDQDPWCRGHC